MSAKLAIAALFTCGAYAAAPLPADEPPPSEPPAAATAPAQGLQVFVYPAKGQNAARTDRDRYECHIWAVKQTEFDPSETHLAPHQRVQVVAMPAPGANTFAGAVTGALIGAAVSRPRDSGAGAAVGAVAGALFGHASDKARQQEADRLQQLRNQRSDSAVARLEQQSNSYRRAIGACLEGRGYTVK
jgi:hypothetical protein